MLKIQVKVFLRALALKEKTRELSTGVVDVLTQKKGDMYVSDVIRIIIAVSLGILLITALIFIFKNQIITGLQTAVNQLFNYSNGSLT
jgi:predicted PurR-regulated permease PerM